MRESAHWADSAMVGIVEPASRFKRSEIRWRSAVSSRESEFPSATQLFLIIPAHLALFTALPRNTSRNSSSVIRATRSRLGQYKLSCQENCLGWNCGILLTGAARL